MICVCTKHEPLSYVRSLSIDSTIWLTVPSKTGKAPSTNTVKTKDMILGGLFGSALNIWWISESLPYRKGFSDFGAGTFGSVWIARSKALLLYGLEVPNDAIMREAESRSDVVRSCVGMSF